MARVFTQKEKKEDEICTSSLSSSTIPLTSGIEEAPQLLLSVTILYHNSPGIGNKYFTWSGPAVYLMLELLESSGIISEHFV
jgi:hypothetical protein